MQKLTPPNHFQVAADYRVNVSGFLSYFESYLSELCSDFDPSVDNLVRHVLLSGGKRIRPSLCYACGIHNPHSSNDLLKASAILEMVHVATLVHDDILDDATFRRGTRTLHNLTGNHTSILLGDALFSFALELSTDFPTTKICKIISHATKITCSGEIRQTFSRGDPTVSIDDYFGFIRDKTGELFRASCQVGATLGKSCSEDINLVGELGLTLGVAYQIYDDLIDAFSDPNLSNKTLGTDFSTGKFTLPFLLLLNSVPESEDLMSTFSSPLSFSSKSILINYFSEYDILNRCLNHFNQQINRIHDIIERISDPSLSQNLSSFISSFTPKLENLKTLKASNFLADICN